MTQEPVAGRNIDEKTVEESSQGWATFDQQAMRNAVSKLKKGGRDVDGFPLPWCRHRNFYSMRTDALDSFGTRLENRFTRQDACLLMERCGLTDIQFNDLRPYWVASGIKA